MSEHYTISNGIVPVGLNIFLDTVLFKDKYEKTHFSRVNIILLSHDSALQVDVTVCPYLSASSCSWMWL